MLKEKIDALREKLDTENLLDVAFNLHNHIEETVSLFNDIKIEPMKCKNVLFLGMGGSGIGGALVKSYGVKRSNIPMFTWNDYGVPSFVGKDTLVVATSYSGNTEETLSGFQEALKRGSKTVAITTGGKLEKMAKESGSVLVKIPSGLQPRFALGYLFPATYIVMIKSGILKEDENKILRASQFIKDISKQWKAEENPPLKNSFTVYEKIPLIYGAGVYSAVAYRWKCQFNENAKMHSFCTYFPELDHNEIVGWESRNEILENITLLVLRHPKEDKRMKARIDITLDIIGRDALEIVSPTEDELMSILYFILYGDLLSLYAAFLRGKDPSVIEPIVRLKKRLAQLT